MSQNFISNASSFELVNKIDADLINKVVENGCPYCCGRLHQANYPRSPFGLSQQFRSYCDERISFCCATCRKKNRSSPKPHTNDEMHRHISESRNHGIDKRHVLYDA